MLELKVIPKSGKQKIVRDKSGIIKCFLKSVPEDGKANRELIDLISSVLSITKASIEIVQGLTSRKKILKITSSLSYEQCVVLLGISEEQKSLW